ncbi:MAG: acyl-CoA dehydrogenase family protein, partial [Dehalococcoidia bacterium]|nr:acyl-CoA dehydrogenase family protein [Dehalococcoidia bacterium]
RHAVPAAWGGHYERPSLAALCAVREALAAASPLADAVFALQALGSMPITLSGNETQQRAWLPRVAAGEAVAAFAMTEPDAGSDVAAMTTRARRDSYGWVLDGRKHLISNAGIADFYTLFAQTEDGAGAKGIACFVVPSEAQGLRFAGAQVLSEPHPLGEIVMHDCRVPNDACLGGPGEGFKL